MNVVCVDWGRGDTYKDKESVSVVFREKSQIPVMPEFSIEVITCIYTYSKDKIYNVTKH